MPGHVLALTLTELSRVRDFLAGALDTDHCRRCGHALPSSRPTLAVVDGATVYVTPGSHVVDAAAAEAAIRAALGPLAVDVKSSPRELRGAVIRCLATRLSVLNEFEHARAHGQVQLWAEDNWSALTADVFVAAQLAQAGDIPGVGIVAAS